MTYKIPLKREHWPLLGFVAVFALIGTFLLYSSHAATPYASLTASSGALAGNASLQTDSTASSGKYVKFGSSSTGGGSGLYSGKLLGLNSYLGDLTSVGNPNVYQQLHINTLRGDIELNPNQNDPGATAFSAPTYESSTAAWLNDLTSAHIVPLPLLNEYVEMDNLLTPAYSTNNVPNFVTATVNWCKAYCAGGSFYTNNSSANPTYAPQILEIMNEPYYGASYGYPVTPTDVNDYGTLLKDIRAALDTAGLTNIGIVAGANDNHGGTANWDSDLVSDGGFAAAQGVSVHPYGSVATSCTPAASISDCTVTSSDTGGTSTGGWGQPYWVHQYLISNGLSTQANSIYVTEDGWCTNNTADECSGGEYTETQKDQNIAAVINQLSTVSWFKGFWYFNLIPYQDCYPTPSTCAYNTYGFYQPQTSTETPAYAAFAADALASGL